MSFLVQYFPPNTCSVYYSIINLVVICLNWTNFVKRLRQLPLSFFGDWTLHASRFWSPIVRCVNISWLNLTPVFAPWAPKVQKGQIFDFNTEPSKLMMKFLECILKPKAKFSVGPEFWFRAPKFFKKFSNSQKCSKFWNFSFFELGPFKFRYI